MHEIREKFVHEFVREFAHEFVREFAHEFVHEFMPEDYVFEEKIWGKVSVSSILTEIFRVEFYLHGQTLRYVDIIKGNILFEII